MDNEIVDELAQLATTAPDFAPRPLKDPSNKGIVRSGFQKAMRRGQTEQALKMGELLMDADPSGAWRAMATVLIEDIGIGDMDLIAYGTVTTLKTIREGFDGEEGANALFAAMVQRACSVPKSRSCCELSLGSDYGGGEFWHTIRSKYEDDETGLIDLMCSQDMGQAYIASCILRKKLRGQGGDALLPALQRIMESLDDWHEARACMMSFERTVDTMNLSLFPIVNRLNNVGDEIEVIDETPSWPEQTIIKSVSSEAFDMHTGIGARALKALWNNLRDEGCEWMQEAEANPPFEDWKAHKTIGSLVFIVEGGLLDQRLMSPTLEGLKRFQDTNFAKGYGVPPHIVDQAFDELLEFVAENIPRLNELRAWSAKK